MLTMCAEKSLGAGYLQNDISSSILTISTIEVKLACKCLASTIIMLTIITSLNLSLYMMFIPFAAILLSCLLKKLWPVLV
jgi:hypothetical protein